MTQVARIIQWNQWYDQAPSDWRFQLVLWPLLALGTINLLLSVTTGFPFALLVVLGIVFITAVRVPYVLGWVKPSDDTVAGVAGDVEPATFQIEGVGWIVNLNRRYDAMSETRRFWVFPAILVIAGAINMLLTIGHGFPFGLLFLLVLLALVAVRAPYAAGWFKPAAAIGGGSGPDHSYATGVEHTPIRAITSESPQEEPVQAPAIHPQEIVRAPNVPPTEYVQPSDTLRSTDHRPDQIE